MPRAARPRQRRAGWMAICGVLLFVVVALLVIELGRRPSNPGVASVPAVRERSTPTLPMIPRAILTPPVHGLPKPPVLPAVRRPPAVQGVRLARTVMLGGTTGGGPFEFIKPEPEPIIGFRIATAQWDGRTIVRTLEPIYASDHLAVTPSMVVAQAGYAVGGVTVDGDDHVTAMCVRFMRQGPTDLDPNDAYDSPWFGQPTTGSTVLLGGDGEAVVGIYGRKGLNVDALGLIQRFEVRR